MNTENFMKLWFTHEIELYLNFTHEIGLLIEILTWHIKLSSFHAVVNRLLIVPLSKQNSNKEDDIIKTIAENNGYDKRIVDSCLLYTSRCV